MARILRNLLLLPGSPLTSLAPPYRRLNPDLRIQLLLRGKPGEQLLDYLLPGLSSHISNCWRWVRTSCRV